MAIYHNTISVINRTSGRSPVAASAYISGEKMTNEYDGNIHDYSKKQGVVYSEVILCENAPVEYSDRERLWNEVVKVEGQTGRRARAIEVALPIEFNRDEQIRVIQNYVKENFVVQGMCADFSIHDKQDGNPHAHIMLTMRPIDENGKWENKMEKVYICKNRSGEEKELTAKELKDTGGEWEKQLPYFKNGKGKALYLTKYEAENNDKYKEYIRVKGKKNPKKTKIDRQNRTVKKWNSEESFCKWREEWANICNRELENKGFSERIDHRSYADQGIEKAPTIHLGKADKMEKRGQASDRGDYNRGIREINKELADVLRQINIIKKEIETETINRTQPKATKVGKRYIYRSNTNYVKPVRDKTVLNPMVPIQRTTRYQKTKLLAETINTYNFLKENGLHSMTDINNKIYALKNDVNEKRENILLLKSHKQDISHVIKITENYHHTKAMLSKNDTSQNRKAFQSVRQQLMNMQFRELPDVSELKRQISEINEGVNIFEKYTSAKGRELRNIETAKDNLYVIQNKSQGVYHKQNEKAKDEKQNTNNRDREGRKFSNFLER